MNGDWERYAFRPPPSEDPAWDWVGLGGGRGLWFFRGHHEARDRALEELVGKGVDDRQRRIRGRVLLELRCRPKGHLVGCVYPTSHGGLFVPSVNEPVERRSPPPSVLRRDPTYIALGVVVERDPWRQVAEFGGFNLGAGVPEEFGSGSALVEWPYERVEPMAAYVLCRCGVIVTPPIWEIGDAAAAARSSQKVARVFCEPFASW